MADTENGRKWTFLGPGVVKKFKSNPIQSTFFLAGLTFVSCGTLPLIITTHYLFKCARSPIQASKRFLEVMSFAPKAAQANPALGACATSSNTNESIGTEVKQTTASKKPIALLPYNP